MYLSDVIRSGLRAYFQRTLEVETLLDLDDFSPHIHHFLTALYTTLLSVTACIATGLYADFKKEIGGRFTMLGFVGSTFCLFITPRHMLVPRGINLNAAAFFLGASFIPYTQPYLNFIDPIFVIAVLWCNASCFACYSIVAMTMAPEGDRPYMYSVAKNYSSTIIWFWALVAFIRFNFFLVFAAYVYLISISLYVLPYSQETVVRARMGRVMDPVNSTIRFFTDFPVVSIYTLILLSLFAEREGVSNWQVAAVVKHLLEERMAERWQ